MNQNGNVIADVVMEPESLFQTDLMFKMIHDRTYTTTAIICKGRIRELSAHYLSILNELPEWMCEITKQNTSELRFILLGRDHFVRFVSTENHLKGMGINTLYVFDNQPIDGIFPMITSGRGGRIIRVTDSKLRYYDSRRKPV